MDANTAADACHGTWVSQSMTMTHRPSQGVVLAQLSPEGLQQPLADNDMHHCARLPPLLSQSCSACTYTPSQAPEAHPQCPAPAQGHARACWAPEALQACVQRDHNCLIARLSFSLLRGCPGSAALPVRHQWPRWPVERIVYPGLMHVWLQG